LQDGKVDPLGGDAGLGSGHAGIAQRQEGGNLVEQHAA